jgi:hypothetical protein
LESLPFIFFGFSVIDNLPGYKNYRTADHDRELAP